MDYINYIKLFPGLYFAMVKIPMVVGDLLVYILSSGFVAFWIDGCAGVSLDNLPTCLGLLFLLLTAFSHVSLGVSP